jgi:hypothetical protein
MMQLPVLLEPWRQWLSLFPDQLAAPLGDLLLRLHPQIGPLRSAPARDDALPEGVGSIVARGPYERLLVSEWAYADAEPDEFLRRAGSGELLFTGPEPAARRRSRRCLALFDAGPAQLGEPRLLHLALFILLARRAQDAGALFEWGILQAAPVTRTGCDKHAMMKLLDARTLSACSAAASAAWESRIDQHTDDAWVIGGPGIAAPSGIRGQVAIRRSLLSERLDVTLTVQRTARTFSLDLPAAALGIRLLRAPFAPEASRAGIRHKGGRPSLTQPPRFGTYNSSIAVAQLDGGIMVYHVPRSTKNIPGKSRMHAAPSRGHVLGVGLFRKSLGSIVADGDTLAFTGFPSDAMADRINTSERPKPELFRAPPMMGRWLQTFFVRHSGPVITATGESAEPFDLNGKTHDAHVLALDLDGQLNCWSFCATRNAGVFTSKKAAHRMIARDVIGVVQFDQHVFFACSRGETTELHSWNNSFGSSLMSIVPRGGSRMLFGGGPGWPHASTHGLIALQTSATEWSVGFSGTLETITVEDGATVLGVVSPRQTPFGLVVLCAGKTSIEIRSRSTRKVVVTSAEPIAQASVNSSNGDIAWITAQSCRLTVQSIDLDKPYLQVSVDEAEHEK